MLLEVRQLRKVFAVKHSFAGTVKGFVRAVDDVSLQVDEQESLGIVGESGSGKTTLARLICRLYPADKGEILFRGKPVTASDRNYHKNVQMVFQDPYSSLDPRFSIRNIIKEGMYLHTAKVKSEQEKEIFAQELMASVQLNRDMLGRYPHEFSGGERQRIAIARALAIRPKLLILDEAVSSLDVIVQEQILDLLSGLQKKFGLTYMFISHNLRAVKKVCNRIAVMYKGKVVEMASAENIFNRPQHPYTQQLLSAALHYQVKNPKDIILPEEGRLIDQGGGHYVLE